MRGGGGYDRMYERYYTLRYYAVYANYYGVREG